MSTLRSLAREARRCTHCAPHLPLGPRPVFQVHPSAKILVAAQAPGTKVHRSGRPFSDPSGDRLRDWMGIDAEIFYDPTRIAILPMGFCYPGRCGSGDAPPRPECAALWRQAFLDCLAHLELQLIIGTYAHRWHFGKKCPETVTATVRHWRDYGDKMIPLPHPSPRNNGWLARNSWFEESLLPELRGRIQAILYDE